jgi:hypothetical protein
MDFNSVSGGIPWLSERACHARTLRLNEMSLERPVFSLWSGRVPRSSRWPRSSMP